MFARVTIRVTDVAASARFSDTVLERVLDGTAAEIA